MMKTLKIEHGLTLRVEDFIQEKIVKLEADNAGLLRENAELRLHNKIVHDENNRLGHLYSQHTMRIALAEDALTKKETECNRLNAAVNGLQKENERLRQEQAQLIRENRTFRNEANRFAKINSHHGQRIMQTEEVLAKKEAECNQLTDFINELRQELQNSKDREKTSRFACDSLETQVKELARIVDERDEELRVRKAQVDSERRAKEAVLQSLNDETYRHNNAAARMAQEIRDLQIENSVLHLRLAAKAQEDEAMCSILESLGRQLRKA